MPATPRDTIFHAKTRSREGANLPTEASAEATGEDGAVKDIFLFFVILCASVPPREI
jgi:hypothetical protein